MPQLVLELLSDRFAVCRLAPEAAIPPSLEGGSLFSVTRTGSELSVVCRESQGLPGEVEGGWRCLGVEGPLEFTQIGVLASLSQPLAEAGISIFVVSTYDTDYLLVKEEQLDSAITALRAAGHSIADSKRP
jgi:hypothetical protein